MPNGVGRAQLCASANARACECACLTVVKEVVFHAVIYVRYFAEIPERVFGGFLVIALGAAFSFLLRVQILLQL